jgi:hypothetical protein
MCWGDHVLHYDLVLNCTLLQGMKLWLVIIHFASIIGFLRGKKRVPRRIIVFLSTV